MHRTLPIGLTAYVVPPVLRVEAERPTANHAVVDLRRMHEVMGQ